MVRSRAVMSSEDSLDRSVLSRHFQLALLLMAAQATLIGVPFKTTVIRFFFVVKIFSYRENVRNFFTRILFYNETFSDEYLGQVRTYSNDAVVDR